MRREELRFTSNKTHHLSKEGQQAFGSLLLYKCKQRYLIYQTCLVPTSSSLSCAISIFARAPYKTCHQLVLTLNPVVYLHYYILQSVLRNFPLRQGRSSAGVCEGVRLGGPGQSVWLNTRNFIQPLITESRLLRELLPRGRCAHAHCWWSCRQIYTSSLKCQGSHLRWYHRNKERERSVFQSAGMLYTASSVVFLYSLEMLPDVNSLHAGETGQAKKKPNHFIF